MASNSERVKHHDHFSQTALKEGSINIFNRHKAPAIYFYAERSATFLAAFVCSITLSAQSGPPAALPLKPTTALVTFVDNGMSLIGGLPGQKSQAFRGKVFVEDKLLATMTPGHFITFQFDPVAISFTAQTWMATGPKGGAHIVLSLQPGKHYFIELRTKQGWPVTKMFGIKEIACEQAREEHEHDELLDGSHAKAGGDPPVVAEKSFPTCSHL